jgi:hypothetical protein
MRKILLPAEAGKLVRRDRRTIIDWIKRRGALHELCLLANTSCLRMSSSLGLNSRGAGMKRPPVDSGFDGETNRSNRKPVAERNEQSDDTLGHQQLEQDPDG